MKVRHPGLSSTIKEIRTLTLILPQSLIPVVMSGIIAVYSLVIAVLIAGDMDPQGKKYSLMKYDIILAFIIRLHDKPGLTVDRSQWLLALSLWSFCRPDRSRSGLCDRCRRRHGSSTQQP